MKSTPTASVIIKKVSSTLFLVIKYIDYSSVTVTNTLKA